MVFLYKLKIKRQNGLIILSKEALERTSMLQMLTRAVLGKVNE